MPGSFPPRSSSPPAGDAPDALWRLGACTCAHCGSPRVRNEDPARTFTYAWVTAALCTECGGRFSHPLPSPELLAQVYKDPSIVNDRWYQEHYPAQLLGALHRVLQYRRRGLLEGRVLDFGDGPGCFARGARIFGHPAETRDPYHESSGAAPIAGSRTGDEASFDTVVCHHVADLTLASQFQAWDLAWHRSRWSYAQAQVHTLRRYMVLAASALVGGARDERAELLIVARRSGAPA